MRKVVLIVSIIGLALLLWLWSAGIALGLPEMVRHNYPSCAACHVAPSGGGALHAYGRAQSAILLPTSAVEGEEGLAHGLVDLPGWLILGGDSRLVTVAARAPGFESFERFWMQNDLELGLFLGQGIFLGGSVGLYGPEQEREYRRSYVGAQLASWLVVRAGKFPVAYGIAFPDHRLPTRAGLGLGQGSETYNAEASLLTEWGDLIITGVAGDGTVIGLQDSGYSMASDAHTGLAARGSLHLGDRASVGLSYLGLSAVESTRQAYGAFALVGFSDTLYLLAEADRRFEDGIITDLATARFGWELLRGFHASVLGDMDGERRAAGAQLQWFPRPHWELLGEVKRNVVVGAEGYVDSGVLMLHHYL